MMLYNIQHFGHAGRLPWLLRMLQHPENRFLITYDGPEARVKVVAEKIAAQPIEAREVRVERSLPIRWCGPSQARMLVEMLRRAAAIPGWEFFVNLSGTCVPLRRQDEIAAHLKARLRDGITAHFFSFPVRKPPVLPVETPGAEVVEVKRKRLTLRGPQALIDQFIEPDYVPIRNPANRLYLGCCEPEGAPGVLEIARPDAQEMAFRRDFLTRYPHHCGRAWYVFHRSAVEALVAFFESPAFDDPARLFFNCFEPDESFLQTLIMNGLVFPVEQVSPESLRAFRGQPRILDDNSIEALKAEKAAFFARKVNHQNAAALRAFVAERVGQVE